MTTKHLRDALHKAAQQKESITLTSDEKGVMFSVKIESSTTFAHLFIPVSHEQMVQMLGEWFASCSLDIQQQHLKLLQKYIEKDM